MVNTFLNGNLSTCKRILKILVKKVSTRMWVCSWEVEIIPSLPEEAVLDLSYSWSYDFQKCFISIYLFVILINLMHFFLPLTISSCCEKHCASLKLYWKIPFVLRYKHIKSGMFHIVAGMGYFIAFEQSATICIDRSNLFS